MQALAKTKAGEPAKWTALSLHFPLAGRSARERSRRRPQCHLFTQALCMSARVIPGTSHVCVCDMGALCVHVPAGNPFGYSLNPGHGAVAASPHQDPGPDSVFSPGTREKKAFEKLNVAYSSNEIFFSHPHTVIIIFHSVSRFGSFSTIFHSDHFTHFISIFPYHRYFLPSFSLPPTLPLTQFSPDCFPLAYLGLSPFSIILHSSS